MLLLPALNEMIDIVTTRAMATKNHPPLVIFLLLAGLSLMGSLLVGYEMSNNKDRSWLHMIAFAGVMTVVVYVIIDIEFPRLGLIKVDASDQVLTDLRKSMH
jgi:amino acid transporter